MSTDPLGEFGPSSKDDLTSRGKGLIQSLSEGVRNLIVLDEKLAGIGRENERSRGEIAKLQEAVFRLIGKTEEMERRLADRFAELDKRLAEIDKRIDLKVELAVGIAVKKSAPVKPASAKSLKRKSSVQTRS